jgi:hypothetical protein
LLSSYLSPSLSPQGSSWFAWTHLQFWPHWQPKDTNVKIPVFVLYFQIWSFQHCFVSDLSDLHQVRFSCIFMYHFLCYLVCHAKHWSMLFHETVTLAVRPVSVCIHFIGMCCSKNGSRYMQDQWQQWKHGLDGFLQVKEGKWRTDRNWMHSIPLCILCCLPSYTSLLKPQEFVHIQRFVRPNVIITASLDHYPLRESLKYTLLVQITDSEMHVQFLYKIFQIHIMLSLWKQLNHWTNPVLTPYYWYATNYVCMQEFRPNQYRIIIFSGYVCHVNYLYYMH